MPQRKIYSTAREKAQVNYRKSLIKKVCLCGCKASFIQSKYSKGYIQGHSQKITRKLMVGNRAPGWKGGIRKKRGYILIYSPNHPHTDGGYVLEHRLKMENRLGRYLESWEHVHHLNGIKDDNRIENLVVITHAEHMKIHRTGKKYNREKRCFE